MSAVELVDDRLDTLASTVRSEYRASRESFTEAIDHYFVVGQALREARELLPSDNAFGAWFRAQEFGFSRVWAYTLRAAAEHAPAVRAAVVTQVTTGGVPNIKKAVKQVTAATGGRREERPSLQVVTDVYPTIVIDPPWQYDNKATRGAAEDHYPTMSVDELRSLELPAADDSHLYLWVTNGFLREALELCDVWDFTYKTLLTWVKPQMGMGNYFRSVTEHVVFGVRGSLPTERRDRTNVVNADRTKHSAKPEAFYDLVEEMSPGPYMEMFARRRRMGWQTWGNES